MALSVKNIFYGKQVSVHDDVRLLPVFSAFDTQWFILSLSQILLKEINRKELILNRKTSLNETSFATAVFSVLYPNTPDRR